MPHFVRCIEGHVFDAEISPQCPTCGAIVNAPPLAPAVAPPVVQRPAPASTHALPEAAVAAAPGSTARASRSTVPVIAVGGAVVVLGAVLAYFALPMINRPVPQSPAAQAPPQTASAPAPSTPPIAKVDITGIIQAALDVVRMNTAEAQHDYRQVSSLAQKLVTQNNPMGPFGLAALATTGGLGNKDPTEARKQFTAAAKLGNPDAAEMAARMMELGDGGPKDLDGAKTLYLFAARNNNTYAPGDLARLNMTDQIGMTVSEADNNLNAGKDVPQSWQLMNQMIAAHSAPATCQAGWLYGAGKSVVSDLKRALDLFDAGAISANMLCTWGLSRLAAVGLPYLPKNQVEADVLLHLASTVAGPSMTDLTTEITTMEAQMSASDKAEVQQIIQSGTLPGNLSAAAR